MTEQNLTEPAQTDGQAGGAKAWKRRGLFAAAWAAVAAVALRETEQPVSASTAMLIANTETAGVSNPTVGPSTVAAASGTYTNGLAPLVGDGHLASSTGAIAGLQGVTLGGATVAPE